ncbi:MAG TPA: rhodanese-like domain-containing protein [Ignavibacteriales bacterium]|nr:rhodanese-like domain-containing protein [Ignavibacteriales bacterium]
MEEILKLINKGAKLVDVRTKEEFEEINISNSINIPLNEVNDYMQNFDKNDVLIFYCVSGARSQYAVDLFRANGFSNVYNGGSIYKLKPALEGDSNKVMFNVINNSSCGCNSNCDCN